MDGSLSGLSTVGMKTDATVFIKDINLGLGVKMSGLVSSTLMKSQAIALALECVPAFRLVDLFLNSQAALDACKSEFLLAWPDFKNRCWIEHHHITNVICDKNLNVNWVKVKGHSAGDSAISGNSRHFVHDIFQSVHWVHWEVGFGFQVLVNSLQSDVDWARSVSVWHPDSHMAAGFTSLRTASFQTYFMKALHHQLPVAVHKRLYNRLYSSIVCLFCGEIEISDHVFSCFFDIIGHEHLINTYAVVWEACSGLSRSSLCISQLLFTCVSNCVVGVALCKRFVFNNWYCKSVFVFKDSRVVACNIVFFVCKFCAAFQDEIWLVHAKHQIVMEKGRLIPRDSSIPASVSGFSMGFSAGVVRLLGLLIQLVSISGFIDLVSVHISA
ncbi:hypothetical protein G9A89_010019 [Geosiphon pyriformis]|nr:hypothetical protein G9A89_010019 [Geosiphon pyriformis]